MSPHRIINNIRKNGTTEQDEKNLQIMNFQNKCQKNSNYIGKRKTKKKQIQLLKTKIFYLKQLIKRQKEIKLI